MTFLELHKIITQTRKARKGVKRYEDFWKEFEDEEPEAEAFYNAVYRRALHVANEVIKHYTEKCEYDPKDKPKLIWKD